MDVNIVSNPLATIDLAAATGANFVRSTFTGAYIGENGITDTNIPETLRRKAALGLHDLKLLFKVNPESDVYMAERSLEKNHKIHDFPTASRTVYAFQEQAQVLRQIPAW